MRFEIQNQLLFIFCVIVFVTGQSRNFLRPNERTNDGFSILRRNGFSNFGNNEFSRFGSSANLVNRMVNRRPSLTDIPQFLQERVPWAYANVNTLAVVDRTVEEPATTTQTMVTSIGKQYNQKGKVFGHCDIGNDKDLDALFPGIFQSETEILGGGKEVIKKERWYGTTMRTYGDKPKKPPMPITTEPPVLAHSNNDTVVQDRRPAPMRSSVCQCCETETRHEVYNNITVDDVSYRVIQLPGKFQAIPVGRCPQSNMCLSGSCVQHYNVHHVLIWNSSVPYWPAFDFALVEYPTHCTWENVGV